MKKRSVSILIASIMVVVAICIIVIKVSNEARIKKTMDLGVKYLGEENYEQAIIALAKATSIDEENTQEEEKYWYCNSCNGNTTVSASYYLDQSIPCSYCGAEMGYHTASGTTDW